MVRQQANGLGNLSFEYLNVVLSTLGNSRTRDSIFSA